MNGVADSRERIDDQKRGSDKTANFYVVNGGVVQGLLQRSSIDQHTQGHRTETFRSIRPAALRLGVAPISVVENPRK